MLEKKTEILISLLLDDEQAALFAGRKALVCPLSHSELIRMRELFDAVEKFLGFNFRSLSTLQELLEGNKNMSGQIAKTHAMMMQPSREIRDVFKEIRDLMERSFVAGGDHPEAKITAPKGPMQ